MLERSSRGCAMDCPTTPAHGSPPRRAAGRSISFDGARFVRRANSPMYPRRKRNSTRARSRSPASRTIGSGSSSLAVTPHWHNRPRSLALRTLGGLSTRHIARAFVEPEATTAQRPVRAKLKIRDAGLPYVVPRKDDLPDRLAAVLARVYLIFNEGHTATDGPSLVRTDLCAEATRLGRLVVELLPAEPEAHGLLALVLLTDARWPARIGCNGQFVPLEEQDRTLWDRDKISEGTATLDAALPMRRPGPYQIQAAIAALHANAPSPERTDWPQIAALYGSLLRHAPTPVVELNAAVALAMATKVTAGLDWIATLEQRGELAGYHLLPASKADLLRRVGRNTEAMRG